jgi:glutamate-1-semialdehyde 2,1-aminomutase
MSTMVILYLLAAVVLCVALRKLYVRLQLSLAKHRSLTGHARWSRRLAALVPFYEYGEDRIFSVDDAPAEVAATRREGFGRLAELFAQRFAVTAAKTGELAGSISDLQFTSRYRVPFQFSRFVRERLKTGSLLESSAGPEVTDLDGNRFFDLTGSYGTNLVGYDV